MFWRALLAFLLLPGLVAFLIPLWLARPLALPGFRLAGLTALLPGVVGLLWCVRDFSVAGKGTLAPWSPPQHLVEVGLYRVSRNPMYLSVLLILVGWAIGFPGRGLWTYTLGAAAIFYLRVVLFEEPWLARTHGEDWTRYRARVPRWLLLG